MVSWALISGASTGIGRATVLALLSKGFNVIAGVRSEAAAERLRQQSSAQGSGRLETTLLDVTDQASIDAAIAQTNKLAGAGGLHVVINNAGIVVPGPVEFVSGAEWRRQFDVNLFGAIELTRATLPLLRRGVEAHGRGVPRLLLVSSIGGRIAQPMMAPYTSSKFAMTALGDSLRLELRRQGIGVTVIEPGAVATDIWAKGDTSAEEFTPDHPARKLYEPELNGLLALARKTASNAMPAERAAQELVSSILAKRAPARVLIGTDAKIMARLKALLPTGVFDNILAKEFGIAER
ncbi:MAG TPA: SDR family oxidoreductase [Edaphobacter sp.]|nr:SDR family oxidoreductase [Edaphobacter sp.]